jgi:pyruvate-ferredoxin/flavodoxin oxidoreductase
VDGSEAVVWVETHITQGGCAYPITPSTPMGEGYQRAVANGKRNLWGEELFFCELESEHSSASACEGFALAGGRVTNFTSGQGLILMKEVLYTIAGKRLPAVFHIGARALTSQALNIHAGHDDVCGVSDCGWGMFFGRNAQETADLALIARRAAEESQTPFLNIQDGFLTTHTVESVFLPEPEMMKEFIGPSTGRIPDLFDPSNPLMSGSVQNQDAYMKGKVAQRFYYDHLKKCVLDAMAEYKRLTGRGYGLVDPYRLEDAEFAIVGMGTMLETAKATVDWLRSARGVPVGCLHVTAFRPFPGPEIVRALKHLKSFAVVERMDNPPAQSNPLTAEIKAAFADALTGAEGYEAVGTVPTIFSGVAGLGSRDVRAGDFVATVERMTGDTGGRRFFVLGVGHPLALPRAEDPDVRPKGAFSMRGHSVGGYGSVTTNKVIATLLADVFGLHVQAYPKYGSEKKGLPTTFFLTAAEEHIGLHCELEDVEFVAVLDTNAIGVSDTIQGLAEGGTLFVPSQHTEPGAVWDSLPEHMRRTLRERSIRLIALDATRIAKEEAPTPDLQVRMQGIALLGVFLYASPFRERKGLGQEALLEAVERALRKYFGRRGEATVQANLRAVQRGFSEALEVPCGGGKTARQAAGV